MLTAMMRQLLATANTNLQTMALIAKLQPKTFASAFHKRCFEMAMRPKTPRYARRYRPNGEGVRAPATADGRRGSQGRDRRLDGGPLWQSSERSRW